MKLILSLLVSAAVCTAETAAPTAKSAPQAPKPSATLLKPEEATLVAGSPVTTDALAKLEWITGSAPKAWEPGKVYLFECWATWCAPCVAAIPHINQFHKKYAKKGLIISGINLWEDGKEKVAEFVKKKGDGMSYNVAYTGKGGAFETDWFNPAGIGGIPHAFVVKDGKLILHAHPMDLTDEVIEALLAGGEVQEKIVASLSAAQAKQDKIDAVITTYKQMSVINDPVGIAKTIQDLKELDADSEEFPMMNFNLLIAKKDWSAAEAAIAELPDDCRLKVIYLTAQTLNLSQKVAPASFIKAIATSLAPEMEKQTGPMANQLVAALFWKAGDKENALKAAKLAVEKAAATPDDAGTALPAAPFTHYLEAMEKGCPPSPAEFSAMIQAEIEKTTPKGE